MGQTEHADHPGGRREEFQALCKPQGEGEPAPYLRLRSFRSR